MLAQLLNRFIRRMIEDKAYELLAICRYLNSSTSVSIGFMELYLIVLGNFQADGAVIAGCIDTISRPLNEVHRFVFLVPWLIIHAYATMYGLTF